MRTGARASYTVEGGATINVQFFKPGISVIALATKGLNTHCSSIMVDLRLQIIQAEKLLTIMLMVEWGVFRNGKISPTWSYRNHFRSRCT